MAKIIKDIQEEFGVKTVEFDGYITIEHNITVPCFIIYADESTEDWVEPGTSERYYNVHSVGAIVDIC